MKSNLKQALGFNTPKESITIFKGDTYSNLEYFKKSVARYTTRWGWYVVGEDVVPTDLPDGIEPVELKWSDVSVNDELLNDIQLKPIIDKLLYVPSNSHYMGEVGGRYALELTVKKAVPVGSEYGNANLYAMEDDEGNMFVWTTSARILEVNQKYKFNGTVKAHNLYQGNCQTVLTNCRFPKGA